MPIKAGRAAGSHLVGMHQSPPRPPHRQLPERDVGRWLNRRYRDGGAPGLVAMAAPVVAGGLIIVQAWLIARALHLAIAEGRAVATLWPLLAGIVAVFALRAALNAGGEIAAVAAAESVKRRLRDTLLMQMLGKGPTWTAAQSSGALSAGVIENVEGLDGFLVRYLPALVQASVLPLAFAALAFAVDGTVGTIFLCTAPLVPVFMMLVGWGAEAASVAQADALARLAGRFADRLRGLLTLKLFGRADAETCAIHDISEDLRRRSMRVMRIAFLSSAVLEFFAALGVAGVALYVGLTYLGLVHLRSVPLGLEAGLFCLIMAPEVYQPLRQLAANYHDRATAKAAARQIEACLLALPADLAAPPALPADAEPARRGAPVVEIAGLTLTTPGGRPVLEDARLVVEAGAQVAILGPSGIGKSTLLEAVAGLRPYYGVIRIGDADAAGVRETGGPAVVLLGQRPHLFAGTIAENIRLGRPPACETAVRLAAERAAVTDFADALPDGLDTVIGENGLGLSGGEIQRICLARIYLGDPDLVLLDEPTAHLDAETERRVLDGLLGFARGRTLIVATHSQAVAASMGRVYRIAGGALLPAPRPAPARGPALRGAA